MSTKLKAGDRAPDFSLPSNQGVKTLAEHLGEWVVVYYYPKDATPGCTQEACDFRDLSASAGLNAQVLGISADDLDSHETFAEAHSLPFPLLSDPEHEVARRYGAYGEKKNYGKTFEGIIRSTFIIDPQGLIAEAMYNVKATGHAERVAKKLETLQGGA